MKIEISHNDGNIKLTGLLPLQLTFAQLCRAFSTPKIETDKLNAGYFLRCAGTKRGNETVADTASLLILDGDSRIDIHGNIVAGAVNPLVVHMMLNHLKIDHFIYTSHSNEGYQSGKCDVMPYWKYRVLIPCTYTREQLPALLEWIFSRFHENDVMLANVKENSSWAQAWFKPAVHPDRAHLFKTWWRVGGITLDKTDVSTWFEPAENFDVERIYNEWLSKQNSPVNHSITTLSTVPVTNLSANPIEAFNASFSVHDVLIRNQYKQQGKRYLHPNSSSKVAGVRILDTGRAYSDSSDSLNDGKSHDAFDCYRLLECGGDMRTALNWNADLTKANQRAFYDVPKTEKPPQVILNGGFNKLVESPNVRSFRPSNS